MSSEKETESDLQKTMKEVGPYLGLGFQLAATIVVLLFIGVWLDNQFGYDYTFTLILGFIGMAAGMYNLIKTATSVEKKNKGDEKK